MSNAPVTLDMIRDERKWIEELARELAGVLQGRTGDEKGGKSGMMKDRGIVALDEVWGGWNRARGVGTSFIPTPSPRNYLKLSHSFNPTLDVPPCPPAPALPHLTANPLSHVRLGPLDPAYPVVHTRILRRAARLSPGAGGPEDDCGGCRGGGDDGWVGG